MGVVNAISRVRQFERGLATLRERATQGAGVLKNYFNQFKDAAIARGGSAFESLKNGISGVAAQLPGLGSGAGGAGIGLTGLGAAGGGVVVALGAVLAVVLAVAAAIAVLTAAVGLGIAALKKIATSGIELNSDFEQTQLGIAATIASLAELRNSGGVKLEGADALEGGLVLAREQMQKLKIDAVNTTATFEQIAPAFQAAIGPGLAAGLTLDQIRETTVKIAQAAGAIGLPMEQLNQEVRAILDGTITEDARLARVLGISNEMVKSWKAQGTLAEELNKRLEKFNLAGVQAANTFSGLTSNLQEAFNVFAAEATTQTFETLKSRIQKILPQIFDLKNAGLDKSLEPVKRLIDDILTKGVQLAADAIEYIIGLVKSVSVFVGKNKDVIDDILAVLGDIGSEILTIFGVQAQMAGGTDKWRFVLQIVRVLLNVIWGLLRFVRGVIEGVALAFNKVSGFIRNGVIPAIQKLISLIPGLSLMAALLNKISGAGGGEVSGEGATGGSALGSGASVTARGLGGAGGGGGKGGGGGGGGSSRDGLMQAEREQRDALLELQRTFQDSSLALDKGFYDQQVAILEERLDEQTISLREFYAERRRLQLEENQREIEAQQARTELERQKFANAVTDIQAKRDITPAQKLVEIETARIRLAQEIEQINQRIVELTREQGDIRAKNANDERSALQKLARTFNPNTNAPPATTRPRIVGSGGGGDDATGNFFDNLFGKLKGGFTGLFDKLGGVFNSLFDNVGGLLSGLGKGLSQVFSFILKGVSAIFGGGLGFASGGHVEGDGTETSDSILARLSKNEFVIRAKSVRDIGLDALHFINNFGRLPALATGGQVSSTIARTAGSITPFGTQNAGLAVNQNFSTTIVTPDERRFRLSQKTIERDMARRARKAVGGE